MCLIISLRLALFVAVRIKRPSRLYQSLGGPSPSEWLCFSLHKMVCQLCVLSYTLRRELPEFSPGGAPLSHSFSGLPVQEACPTLLGTQTEARLLGSRFWICHFAIWELGKPFPFSVSLLPHLQNGDNESSSLGRTETVK